MKMSHHYNYAFPSMYKTGLLNLCSLVYHMIWPRGYNHIHMLQEVGESKNKPKIIKDKENKELAMVLSNR